MPCPFTGPKMFWAGPNFLRQTKNLFTYCGCHKHFAPDQKCIYILWQSQTFCARLKDDLHSVKLFFCAGTKIFEEAVKFLVWLKNFRPAQNFLGPVKGQGISYFFILNFKDETISVSVLHKAKTRWIENCQV